jgi:hypothetical protein
MIKDQRHALMIGKLFEGLLDPDAPFSGVDAGEKIIG